MPTVAPPPPTLQLALPVDGGFPSWGVRALQAAQQAKRDAPDDPGQGALPGFGVMPGALWRAHTAKPTGLERLPAEFLELRRGRHRDAGWKSRDLQVRDEIRARTITLATAMRWRTGAGAPPWFVGLVPRRLRPLMAVVWTACRRGAFGLRDTYPAWAAHLDTCTKTIANYIREAEDLGLVSRIQLWTEHDGQTRRCVVMLRPGPVLESIAGIVAFEFSKSRPYDVRLSFPGELRTVRGTKANAAKRRRALEEASKRFHADQRHRNYQARSKATTMVRSSPEVFARYLEAVLNETEVSAEVDSAPPIDAPKRREAPRQCAVSAETAKASADALDVELSSRVEPEAGGNITDPGEKSCNENGATRCPRCGSLRSTDYCWHCHEVTSGERPPASPLDAWIDAARRLLGA